MTNDNQNDLLEQAALSDDEVRGRLQILSSIIGGNIRRERKRRGFTIERMASVLGLTPSYLGLLERGARCPSLNQLVIICNALGFTTDELLTQRGKAHSKTEKVSLADPANADLRGTQEAVLTLMPLLTADELKYIVSCIQGLVDMRKQVRGSK